MAILVAATFLLMNGSNLSSVYGCTNSSSTNHTSGVNGTSGNITKSAFNSPGQISIVDVADKIPVGRGPCGVATTPNGQNPY
jgi:hypothetical protein